MASLAKTRRRTGARATGHPAGGAPRGASEEQVLALNVAAIKAHRPALLGLATAPPDWSRFHVERDGAGRIVNVLRKDGDGKVAAWHAAPADAELAELWSSVQWKGMSMAALIGLGYGRELGAMLQSRDTLVRRLIVIEPDADLFRIALRCTPMSAAFAQEHVPFFVGLDLPALSAAVFDFLVESQNIRYVKTLGLLVAQGAMRMAPEYVRHAAQAVATACKEALTFMGNSPQDSLLGLEHLLMNLGVIIETPGLADLLGTFKGRPAFVASAGPSLPAAFDVLRQLQDDVLILCPDTSLKPLLAAGIRPHLACSRERTPRTARLFKDVQAQDTWLAAAPVLHPSCFRHYTGQVVSIFRKAGHFPWLGLERGALDFNGSAGNMAFRLAEEMGCDPIVLVGQDLAFGEGGDTHVGGAATGSRQKVYDHMEKVLVPGNKGRPVTTTQTWLGFLRRYEYDVANYAGTCVNATDGGALIRGTVVKPLAEAVRDHLPPSVRQPVRPRLQAALRPPSPEQRGSAARFVHAHIQQTRKLMDELMATCRQSIAVAQATVDKPVPALFGNLPPDVQVIIRQQPLKDLDDVRMRVIGKRMFFEFVMPTAQSVLVNWEVAFYGLQRTCANGAELFRAIVPRYIEWFQVVESLIRLTVDRLPWGERSLHEHSPDLLPPPAHPMPARTMVDIIRETTPGVIGEDDLI